MRTRIAERDLPLNPALYSIVHYTGEHDPTSSQIGTGQMPPPHSWFGNAPSAAVACVTKGHSHDWPHSTCCPLSDPANPAPHPPSTEHPPQTHRTHRQKHTHLQI